MAGDGIAGLALACKCPRCGKGGIYGSRLSLTVRESCPECGLPLARNDSADGPAVLLIFVLGALLVPLAFLLDRAFAPPLWVHAVLWGGVALGATLWALRPLKALLIALQYRHRPGDWETDEKAEDRQA